MKVTMCAATLAVMSWTAAASARAQTVATPPEHASLPISSKECIDRSHDETRTFFLKHATSVSEQNEILTALRNFIDSSARIFPVPSSRAVIVRADAQNLARAAKLIDDLDRLPHSYRLVYTLTEKESGNSIGQQHYAVLAEAGQRIKTKSGQRVPIHMAGPGKEAEGLQLQYIDVGLNIDATADETSSGLQLRIGVERSSVAEDHAKYSLDGDPLLRQSVVEATVSLPLNQQIVIGSLDVPGSTRTLEIAVMAELAK